MITVGKLEAICAGIKDKSLDVFIKQTNDTFSCSAAETAKVKNVKFKGEGILKKEEPTIECLVITDVI